MFLIAALGNPGREYAKTRHNVGYMTADAFCEAHGITGFSSKFSSLCASFTIFGEKVILINPLTYMNDSGRAVREAVDFYKIPPQNVIVIHDDVEFPLGVIKIRASGSGGTHNGMKSVVACLGSKDFPRLKFGVGDERGGRDLRDYVLSPFSPQELEIVLQSAKRAVLIIDTIIAEGINAAMNKYNPRREKPTPAPKDSVSEMPEVPEGAPIEAQSETTAQNSEK